MYGEKVGMAPVVADGNKFSLDNMDLDRRDGAGDPYDPFYKVNVS
jgi:hypothetical protein